MVNLVKKSLCVLRALSILVDLVVCLVTSCVYSYNVVDQHSLSHQTSAYMITLPNQTVSDIIYYYIMEFPYKIDITWSKRHNVQIHWITMEYCTYSVNFVSMLQIYPHTLLIV